MFQQWMQDLLLDPFQKTNNNPIGLLPQAIPVSSIEAIVNHSEKLPAREHLAIYQRSYIARLRGCMSQQFSALEYALGEDLFRAFADDYLVKYPSTNYNLSALGANFTNHLQANRPDAETDEKEDWIDFIIELAKFEYDINIIFEQQADDNYEPVEINESDEKLELIPILNLFKFQCPVRSFYTSFKNGEQPNLPFESETHCVVLRHDYKLFIFDLPPEQYEFLTYLKSGMNMAHLEATMD
jgi:Putative DNA-binding domain